MLTIIAHALTGREYARTRQRPSLCSILPVGTHQAPPNDSRLQVWPADAPICMSTSDALHGNLCFDIRDGRDVDNPLPPLLNFGCTPPHPSSPARSAHLTNDQPTPTRDRPAPHSQRYMTEGCTACCRCTGAGFCGRVFGGTHRQPRWLHASLGCGYCASTSSAGLTATPATAVSVAAGPVPAILSTAISHHMPYPPCRPNASVPPDVGCVVSHSKS